MTTYYPGVGADEAINELKRAVGDFTAFWAEVEDGLFVVFVVAIAGKWLVGDIHPYRAVFFSFGSYEQKMKMVHNAMKTRFSENKDVLDEWAEIRRSLNGAATLRNEIAHLVPMAQSSPNKEAKANVRLIPPFWKQGSSDEDFDSLGYSLEELLHAQAPFVGYRPPQVRADVPMEQLSYRLQQFGLKLMPRPPSSPASEGA